MFFIKNEWISIDKAHPEFEREVLTYYSWISQDGETTYYRCEPGSLIEIRERIGNVKKYIWNTRSEFETEKVTHWMYP